MMDKLETAEISAEMVSKNYSVDCVPFDSGLDHYIIFLWIMQENVKKSKEMNLVSSTVRETSNSE